MTMSKGEQPIRFDDGAAYERGMGIWSQLVANEFLDWLALPHGKRWIDVGCGNGAFTESLISRCMPHETQAIDQSEDQLDFARKRKAVGSAVFQQADAMALPFDDDRFDAAVMALVIFFVPNPAGGVAEMTRVVRPGGLVAAYAWDIAGGGLPFEPIRSELARMGVKLPMPPQAEVSGLKALQRVWAASGLESVETRVISVQRIFGNFDEFWSTSMLIGGLAETVAAMASSRAELLRWRVRTLMRTNEVGQIVCDAKANTVRGLVPM
ncbi:class I SAM-dependent methyltransferase [Caballeronia sordidicola]|uniref:class I SAM-dependent methyltransferase n=1 Tax=Caballeronia sordidicola TaxID=196367 RepID=UPI001C4F7631|nr:class I SAM-dependent methyltransferase [Caballeronia sordidicola]